jgi:FimV-like protein
MLRKLARVAAWSCTLLGPAALALGLGDIKVSSALNQPFLATIPLISTNPEEVEQLRVALASNEAFASAGVERAAYLSTLKLDVLADGGPKILIRSDQVARDPLLVLLIEAKTGGTRVLREYSVLLDPVVTPSAQAAVPAQPAPVAGYQAPAVNRGAVSVAQPAPVYRQPEGISPDAFRPVPPPSAPPPAGLPEAGIATQPVPDDRPPAGAPVVRYAAPVAPAAAVPSLPPVVRFDAQAAAPALPERRSGRDYYLSPEEIAALRSGPRFVAPARPYVPPSEPARSYAPETRPVPAPVEPVRTVASRPAPSTDGDQYGPIRPGQTLRNASLQVREGIPGASLEQVMLALYQANPEVFSGGDINGLQRGVMLRIPPADVVLGVGAGEAYKRVRRLIDGGAAAASTLEPAPAPASPVAATTAAPEPPAEAAPETGSAAAATNEPPAPAEAPAPAAAEAAPAEPATVAQTPTEQALPPLPPEADSADTKQAEDVESLSGEEEEAAPAEADTAGVDQEIIDLGDQSEPPAPPLWMGWIQKLEDAGLVLDAQGLARTGFWVFLLLLLLIALIAVRSWSRQRARREYEKAAKAVSKTSATKGKSQKSAGPSVAAAAAVSARDELEALNRQLPTEPAPVAAKPATTGMVPPRLGETPAAKLAPTFGSAAAAAPADKLGVELAASTQQIDLQGNDPLSEADFHIAYGLYDEAILLLQRAIENKPDEDGLRIKLAETYFAAGKTVEFEQTAKALKPRANRDDWQKLAILGRQILPGNALFEGDEGPLGQVDLAFDETRGFERETVAAAGEIPTGPRIEPILDFKLEDLEPRAEARSPPTLGEPPLAVPELPEFDLSEFDLGPAVSAGDPAKLSLAAAEVTRELDAQAFDLGEVEPLDASSAAAQLASELDTEPFAVEAVPQAAAAPSQSADANTLEFKLDELALELNAAEAEAPISDGDEVSTKLDLARAYVEMGDSEMARGLLQEVAAQGSAVQKSEAQALLARLEA